VIVLDHINKDGIKFLDMTAAHLIDRLAQIETDSSLIWSLLQRSFGQDYFLREIEEEYGVTNASSEKLIAMMHAQIAHMKQTYEKEVERLQSKYQAQLEMTQKMAKSAIEESAAMQRSFNLQIA